MSKGSFLELGLGHGYTIREFLKHVKEYTILEGSKAVIDNFKLNEPKLFDKIKIIETYFETFKTEKKYDYIIMGFILEHVENPYFILNKYKKYLNKNGKIFIAVPNAESLHRQIGFHANLMDDTQCLSESDLLLGHRRYYNISELTKLAVENNMKINSIEGIFLKPFMTSQLQLLNLSSDIIDAMLEMGKKYPELSNAILMELEIE
jgi:2-polyprenyl-3-methyl-5-hydroxy-6-metoxy-1,4-benzoquinol methylase